MKYTQSNLPYITLLLMLIVVALLDAAGSVQTATVIEIDLNVSDQEIEMPIEGIPSPDTELITENR